MTGQSVRQRFMRRLTGMERYSRATAWAVVGVYCALIAAGVAFGAYLLSLPLSWATGALMAVTALFIGTRLRGLNNIVHECCHSSFSAHRGDNTLIGKFCSAVLTGCFKQYKANHLSHHAHLGDYEHDAELAVIEKFGLHEPLSPRSIWRLFLAPLTGRHLKVYSGVNFSGEDGPFFYWLKIGLLVATIIAAVLAPLTTLIFVVIPLFYIFPTLNFWTDCLDHAGLVGEQDELAASRNVLAPSTLRLLFFPRNDCYHLVHHLFPQVPARHLPRAHEALCTDPEYSAQPLATQPILSAVASRRPVAPRVKNGVDTVDNRT